MTSKSKIKYAILFLTIVSLIYIYHRHIEFQNIDYTVQNEKGEKLNAVVIAKGDVVRVKFNDFAKSKFISIVKEANFIGVNHDSPLYLGQGIYLFGYKAKKISYSFDINYSTLKSDTIRFYTFDYFFKMDLTKLGEEIVVFKNK